MPKPKPNESESQFIQRCVIDPEAIRDFPDREQRLAFCYSQFKEKENKFTTKNFVDSWRDAFDNHLRKAEKRLVGRVKNYYKKNYYQAIDIFLNQNKIETVSVFKTDDWKNLYMNMYVDIGVDFAKWYVKNFEKFVPKFERTRNDDIFEITFRQVAREIMGSQITLVQGTALSTLKKILKRRMSDPEFMALGEREKARILRSEFFGYSDFQARRLVRTESTFAANRGVEEGALSLFPADQLYKKWITARDGRVRSFFDGDDADHVEMERHPEIPFKDLYTVPHAMGADRMLLPAAPNAKAANRINCRCSSAPIPIPNAQAIDGLTGMGVGLSGTAAMQIA